MTDVALLVFLAGRGHQAEGQGFVGEIRKSTGFSTDFVHVFKAHIPLIGLGNVKRLLVGETPNRKE